MKKEERLRGRGVFMELIRGGEKIDGRFVRCFFLIRAARPASVHVGFSAPSKSYIAVRRNRFRRVMREAYRIHHSVLAECSSASGRSIDALFMIRSKPPVGRIDLLSAQADIGGMCDRIVLRCRPVTP